MFVSSVKRSIDSTIEGRKARLFKRVKRNLQHGDLRKAISRLEGALYCNPLDKELNNNLANLYFQNHDLVKAGKHWYLDANLNEKELTAIMSFTNSLGNDPTLILKKLITKQFYKLNFLEDFQLDRLKNLLNGVKMKERELPKFLRSLDNHIQRRAKSAAINRLLK